MNIFKKGAGSIESFFQKVGVVSIVTAIVFGVLGLILMTNPELVLSVIFYVLGAIFLIVGIFKLFSYFMERGQYNLQNQDLAFGIIAIIAGLVVIFAKDTITGLLAIVIGVWIIYIGLVRLGLAINLRRTKSEFWITVAVIAAIIIFCGIYMLVYPQAVATTIGLIMLIYAVLDLIESVIYLKTVKQLY